MALSKDLTILFGDISVAVVKTAMPEGDPVSVEPPKRTHLHGVASQEGFERYEGRISSLS